jgi:hypothetical protein
MNHDTIRPEHGPALLAAQAHAAPRLRGSTFTIEPTDLFDEAEHTGARDAGQSSFDELSHDPRLPSQEAVLSIAQDLVDTVAEQGLAAAAAATDATMATDSGSPLPSPRRHLSVRTIVLATVVFGTETFLGAVVPQKLLGSSDVTALLYGMTLACGFAAVAWVGAQAVYSRRNNLLRTHGWLTSGLLALGVVTMVVLAAAVVSGVAGGSSVSVIGGRAEIRRDNWLLLPLYASVVATLTFAVAVSHYQDLADAARRRVDESLARLDARPTASAAAAQAAKILRATEIVLVEAVDVAHGTVRSYVAGARAALPTHLVSHWDATPLLEHAFEVDGWLERVRDRRSALDASRAADDATRSTS